MHRLLLGLMLLLSVLSAAAGEIRYKGLTINVTDDVSAEVPREHGALLTISAPVFRSALFLAELDAATNAPMQITNWANIYSFTEARVLRLLPGLKALTSSTNELTLGTRKVMEVTTTATYRDPDLGTMSRIHWVFAAAGKIWQAALQDGGKQEMIKARSIIAGVRPDSDKPPRPNTPPAPPSPSGQPPAKAPAASSR